MTFRPSHRTVRSLAVAIVALLLIAGGAVAHDATTAKTLVTGPDPAITTTGADEASDQDDRDAVDEDTDTDTDADDADEAEAPEPPEIEQPDLVEVKAQTHEQQGQAADENDDDQGENEDNDGEQEHDGGDHDGGG